MSSVKVTEHRQHVVLESPTCQITRAFVRQGGVHFDLHPAKTDGGRIIVQSVEALDNMIEMLVTAREHYATLKLVENVPPSGDADQPKDS